MAKAERAEKRKLKEARRAKWFREHPQHPPKHKPKPQGSVREQSWLAAHQLPVVGALVVAVLVAIVVIWPRPPPCTSPSITSYLDPSTAIRFFGANKTMLAQYNFSLNNSGGTGSIKIGFWVNQAVELGEGTYQVGSGANVSEAQSFFLTNVTVNDFGSVSARLTEEGQSC